MRSSIPSGSPALPTDGGVSRRAKCRLTPAGAMPQSSGSTVGFPGGSSTPTRARQPNMEPSRPPLFELQVLEGTGIRKALDEPRRRFVDPRPHPPGEGLLVERRDEHALGDDLLDLVQQALTFLAIQLIRLPLEEIFDLGKDAVRVGAALGEEGLDPR